MSAHNASPPAGDVAAVVRLHLWLETDDGVAFGLGRLLLLEALDRTHSLKAAAESMHMSYRAAWGKLKNTEEVLGHSLVEKVGGNRSGYSLTPYGQELVRRFRHWFDTMEAMAVEKARDILPFAPTGYGDRRP
ncbi:MAG: winged helix-turn-helix domain-containing protein [Desulfovibrionaceae bacterium]